MPIQRRRYRPILVIKSAMRHTTSQDSIAPIVAAANIGEVAVGDRFLPDKAIPDLVDGVVARDYLQAEFDESTARFCS